jgi:glycosyltransferase involved in cell wall biosynthesis
MLIKDARCTVYNLAMDNKNYVLITAARNEEEYIEATIESVLSQTILPKKWVIVSDASIDSTDDIVKRHLEHTDIIEFIRKEMDTNEQFDFASKVFALNAGYERIKDYGYRYIGHLDADITMEPDYYEKIISKFNGNKMLGIAGGFIYETMAGCFKCRPYNTSRSVAGAIQLFRRECYEQIGGFIPLRMGGEDTYAEVVARKKGWKVQSFPEIVVYHHKVGNLARGKVRECFRKGMAAYSLGSHPLFEVVKSIRRGGEKPYGISFFSRIIGFAWPYLWRQDRLVSDEFIEFMRKEQLTQLRNFIMRRGSLA